MMGFGAIFTVLILAALAYALGWLPQSGRPTRFEAPEAGKSALDILKERYARGEITKAEYEEMRDELRV
jgi:putative membrane protein